MSRTRLAGVATTVFGSAFAALLVAQLSLMSLLDTRRAEEASRSVAESRFVAGLVTDAVSNVVTPLAGPEVAAEVAAVASTDPRVRDIVTSSLVGAHRQVVDPSSGPGVDTSMVNSVVGDVLNEAGALTGVDLTGAADQVQVPDARPDRLPDVGLRDLALRTRLIAAVIAVVAAVAAVAVHPRPARGLSRVGATAGFVCAGWAIGLAVVSWIIGRIETTLFGELVGALWSSAGPAMLGVVVAGVLLGAGTWLGGRAVDGLLTARPGRR